MRLFRTLAEANDEVWFPLHEDYLDNPFEGTLADPTDQFAAKVHYQIFHAAFKRVSSTYQLKPSNSSNNIEAIRPTGSLTTSKSSLASLSVEAKTRKSAINMLSVSALSSQRAESAERHSLYLEPGTVKSLQDDSTLREKTPPKPSTFGKPPLAIRVVKPDTMPSVGTRSPPPQVRRVSESEYSSEKQKKHAEARDPPNEVPAFDVEALTSESLAKLKKESKYKEDEGELEGKERKADQLVKLARENVIRAKYLRNVHDELGQARDVLQAQKREKEVRAGQAESERARLLAEIAHAEQELQSEQLSLHKLKQQNAAVLLHKR